MDQVQICPNCKKENPSFNLFCQNCGARLNGPQAVPPAPPPVAPAIPAPFPPPPAAASEPAIQPPDAPLPPLAYPPPPEPSYALNPPPAAADPPPPPPPPPTPLFGKFGARIDSWVELVEDSAELAESIDVALEEELNNLDIPMLTLSTSEMGSGAQQRKFRLVTHPAGATVAVFSGAYGKDLRLSWDLYQRRTIRLIPIVVLLGICAFLSLVSAVGGGSFFFFLRSLVIGFFNWILPVLIVALVAGKVLLNDFWGFLLETDPARDSDAALLAIAVQRAIRRAFEKSGGDPTRLHPKQ